MRIGRASEKFALRLPEGLRNQIRETADKNLRSMNAEIVIQLEQIYSQSKEKGEVSA
ncbi:Arc family DNA-binding protein [Rhizobium sp. Root1203]|uniref:Arc family DNA-binding protein n=1 Tax=Rhizobium sp. Root1203 TaxID=1736427 RepID=UPI0009E9D9B6